MPDQPAVYAVAPPALGRASAPTSPVPAHRSVLRPLLVAVALGAAVSLSAGVYGRVHTPTGQAIFDLGFPSLIAMKAWLATGAFALALGQLVSALWMWGHLPLVGPRPVWLATCHRWCGTAAFLLTLPVAYHCLWSLGLQSTDARVVTHSILGCAFYGAFTTKLLVLRSDRVPSWAMPVMGGALVTLVTGLWLTSSLWYFTTVGFPA